MAVSQQLIHGIADAFRSARRGARSLPGFPGEIPTTLEDAYQVQDHAIGQWGDRVAGWKIGGIPPALRPGFGGVDRLAGPVFSRYVSTARSGEQLQFPVFEGGFAAVEAEFVLRIGRDVAPGECPAQQVADIVDAVFLGIETAGSPLATINELGPLVVISDFGNNHGLIVGPEIPDWRGAAFDDLVVKTSIDGAPVGEGGPRNLAGGPLGSLAFLVDVLARRGRGLARGDLITTGAVTGIHAIKAGSSARVAVAGIGEISVLAVPAKPLS